MSKLNLDFDADNAPSFEITEGAKTENRFATHESRKAEIEQVISEALAGVFQDRHAAAARALDKFRAEQEELKDALFKEGRPEAVEIIEKMIELSHRY